MHQLFSVLGLVFSLATPAEGAIFGDDNRYSPREGLPTFELSRSTAVAVLSSNFHEVGEGKIRLEPATLNKFLCTNERFAEDPSLSYACSGFLVAPDLIVTAGHCMVNTGETRNNSKDFCEVFSWLFDYRAGSASGKTQVEGIPSDKLYRCKQVIYAVKDEAAPFRDYALVQLDRSVLDRKPLRLATVSELQEPLTMIGYPLGMPAKVSPGGRTLLNNPERESFLTNLDAFEGNSGSAVFNSANEVVGILVGGTPSVSFVEAGRSCAQYNRCDEDARNCALPDQDTSVFPGFQGVGSEVQRIAPLLELLRSLQK